MAYNLILGAGRDPKYAGTPVLVSLIEDADLNAGAAPPDDEKTAAIPSQTQIVAISITAKQMDRTQSSTNAVLSFYVNDGLVATYLCPTPNTAGDPAIWYINDIVPYNYLNIGPGVLKGVLHADNGGVTGYIIQYSCRIIGIEV